jgi:ABC-type nickel/cobalt efflux system permease component RcnA
MATSNLASSKRDTTIARWIYGFVLLLIVGGFVYILAAAPLSGNTSTASRTPLGEAALAFVQNTLRASAASPAFPPLALVAAFVLGGLHALTPGHNKTLTGSYLVGARGQLRHAVFVGTATAFSHTASAIVIGVLALSTAGQIASTQFLRWIGLPSGMLTLLLGIWLLRKYSIGRSAHPHLLAQDHDHDQAHDDNHVHDHPAPDRVTLGGLVALGLMHGIVPTIDALAILLIALNVRQAGLGIGLVIAYSLGLASVLIAVGALFVRTQRVLLGNPRFERVSRLAPALAAGMVILLGLSLVVRTLIA